MIRLHLYSGVRDNAGAPHDLSIGDVIETLRLASREPRDTADKNVTSAFSTARYPVGATRSKDAALDASAIALDCDEGWTLDAAEAACNALWTPFVIYTTTKSSPDHHRFRVVLFLDRPVNAAEYEELWLALAQRFGVTLDAKTRDISRLSIIPRAWRGGHNVFRSSGVGLPLDVDAILSGYVAPEPIVEPPRAKRPTFFDPLAAARSKLRSMRNQDVDPAKLSDLDDSPIITGEMLERARTGTGRTFRMLCAAASSGLRQGYPVDEAVLADMSREFTRRIDRGRKITDFEHRNDARNAMQWARDHVL